MLQQIMSYLPALLCPLMMLFCMRGMFSKDKDCHKKPQQNGELQQQMSHLEEQNRKLVQEIQELKKGIS